MIYASSQSQAALGCIENCNSYPPQFLLAGKRLDAAGHLFWMTMKTQSAMAFCGMFWSLCFLHLCKSLQTRPKGTKCHKAVLRRTVHVRSAKVHSHRSKRCSSTGLQPSSVGHLHLCPVFYLEQDTSQRRHESWTNLMIWTVGFQLAFSQFQVVRLRQRQSAST